MSTLDAIFQHSSGYIVAAMISEKAYHDSIIKKVIMIVIRAQNEPKKLEKSSKSKYPQI